MKDALNKGHLSIEDTVYSPNNIQYGVPCTNLPLKQEHFSIQDSQLGENCEDATL